MSATFYLEKWNGARFTAIAWFSNIQEAERELAWIYNAGNWHGMPPRIVEEPFPPGIRRIDVDENWRRQESVQ